MYEFKPNTNRIIKYFLSVLRFEPRVLGGRIDVLPNSAMLSDKMRFV
jgi:hypothetical protein